MIKADIPLCNLKRLHTTPPLYLELQKSPGDVLDSNKFILGPNVKAFEEEFAQYCHAEHGIGVGSGTDALRVALLSLGIGPGDRVLVPAFTFVATAFAVTSVGAEPVFVDVDDYGLLSLDPSDYENTYADGVKAVIYVHLYGHGPAYNDFLRFKNKCHDQGWYLIEDCAQAHGAYYGAPPFRAGYQGRIGSIGDMGCFSFYPSKNLGALGDGGMVITSNPDWAKKARMVRNYGRPPGARYEHLIQGVNTRLDEMQAAILRKKLKYLDGWNTARSQVAETYNRCIMHEFPSNKNSSYDHVYHLYVIQDRSRDALSEYLQAQGISTAIHYPQALPDLDCFSVTTCPNAQRLAQRCLSLPMDPTLTLVEIKYVAYHINRFFGYV